MGKKKIPKISKNQSKMGVKNSKFWPKIAELSRHQNGCTLRFLMYNCSVFNQKNFESALLSLRGWKMTFLKVDFNHFDRIFIENCKNDFVLIDLLFPWNLVNKKVNFHTLKLKSALSNFFWLEPLQIHIRNCKNQPFWCRDNSAIFQWKWTKINL